MGNGGGIGAGTTPGVFFDGVCLVGEASGQVRTVDGLSLVVDSTGITITGPSPDRVNAVPWDSVLNIEPGEAATFPSGRAATVVAVELPGRTVRLLVPAEQLEPADVGGLARYSGRTLPPPPPAPVMPPEAPPAAAAPPPPAPAPPPPADELATAAAAVATSVPETVVPEDPGPTLTAPQPAPAPVPPVVAAVVPPAPAVGGAMLNADQINSLLGGGGQGAPPPPPGYATPPPPPAASPLPPGYAQPPPPPAASTLPAGYASLPAGYAQPPAPPGTSGSLPAGYAPLPKGYAQPPGPKGPPSGGGVGGPPGGGLPPINPAAYSAATPRAGGGERGRRNVLLGVLAAVVVVAIVVAAIALSGGSKQAGTTTTLGTPTTPPSTTATTASANYQPSTLRGPSITANPQTVANAVEIKTAELPAGWKLVANLSGPVPVQDPASEPDVVTTENTIAQCAGLQPTSLQALFGESIPGGPLTYQSSEFSPPNSVTIDAANNPQNLQITDAENFVTFDPDIASEQGDLRVITSTTFFNCLKVYEQATVNEDLAQQGGTDDGLTMQRVSMPVHPGLEAIAMRVENQTVIGGTSIPVESLLLFAGAGRMEGFLEVDSGPAPLPPAQWATLVNAFEANLARQATLPPAK